MLFHSRKPVKVVCNRTWLILRGMGHTSDSGMRQKREARREGLANSLCTAAAFTAWELEPGGTGLGKICCGQEEGPKTWSQSSFQTLLFLYQQ